MASRAWDLGYSVFKAGSAVFDLIKASAEDDVQCQAVLALEGLGAGCLVSQHRIGDAVEALSQRKVEWIERLKITIGLSGGGIARVLRKSTPCLAAFLLAMACKTCFSDEDVGSILFEMMVFQGLIRQIPVSAWQVGQLIGAVSGYGDRISAQDCFVDVARQVQANLCSPNEMPGLLRKAEHKSMAIILARVFGALRDQDVTRVTMEGSQSGIWLASIFLFLIPEDLEISIYNKILFGKPCSRLAISFKEHNDPQWSIMEWKAGQVSDLIVEKVVSRYVSTGHDTPMDFIPASSAKTMLASQYRLSFEVTETVGQLAAVLIEVAVESGRISQLKSSFSSQETAPTVPLSDICQLQFLSKKDDFVGIYGWQVNGSFHEICSLMAKFVLSKVKANREKDASQRARFLEEEASRRIDPLSHLATLIIEAEVDACSQRGQSRLFNNYRISDILEPAVRVAAEALRSCLCRRLPRTCTFRSHGYADFQMDAYIVHKLISNPDEDGGLSITTLRTAAIRKSFSSSVVQSGDNDLIVSGDGYVAYPVVLQTISTSRRECCAIDIVPGTIRWGDQQTQFLTVQQVPGDYVEFPTSFSGTEQSLSLFDQGRYTGFKAPVNVDEYSFENLISSSGRNLLVRSFLKSRTDSWSLSVNWIASVEELAVAETIPNMTITPKGELLLARALQDKGAFEGIVLLPAQDWITTSSMTGRITVTASDITLRFFAAGILLKTSSTKLYIRHATPLIQCVHYAQEQELKHTERMEKLVDSGKYIEGENRSWVIIA
ncbi:MAG: hypothetical protein M1836_001171 [Candelina mexicana]|nr:MAG: hypothetical protein M1836_001171 [Candelina mexicana]